VQARQKHAGRFANPVGDHRAFLQLEIQRGADQLLRHLEQLLSQRHQLFGWQSAVAIIHGFGQRIGNPRTDPDHCGLLDTKLHGDGVGGLESDAADVARQPIRVLGHDLDGVGAVGLEDPHRPGRAHAMAVQKKHDFPDSHLFGPGSQNAGGANRPDAIDFPQPVRRCFDHVEYLVAEGTYQLLCIHRANAADHAGRQVFLDPVGRIGERGAQKPRFELLAVSAIVDPFARGGDPLAGGDCCGVSHRRNQVAMTTRFGAQDAEAILGVMISDALDESGEHFLG
jgi:hypothetical protein